MVPFLPSPAAPREGEPWGVASGPLRQGQKRLSPESPSSAPPELCATHLKFYISLKYTPIKQCTQSSFLCEMTHEAFMGGRGGVCEGSWGKL